MKKRYSKFIFPVFVLLMTPFLFRLGFFMAEKVYGAFGGKQKTTVVTSVKNSGPASPEINSNLAAESPNINVPPASPPQAESSNSEISDKKAGDTATGSTFAVIGDTKSFSTNPNGNLEKAIRSLSRQSFDLAFVMGDLVQSCDGGNSCEKKYGSWKSIMAPILSKTYEVVGNHDRTGGDKADAVWQREFSLPANGPAGYSELTYSFDEGNSHFVVLDSEKPAEHVINAAQRGWLDQDLANNKKENVFVFYHEPAYQMSQDSKDALDANPGERDLFWNILKKYQVTAVFNGHLHMIARKKQDGIEQFVVGDTDSTADDVPQKNLTDFGLTGHHYAIVSTSGKAVDVKIYSLGGNLENDFSFS